MAIADCHVIISNVDTFLLSSHIRGLKTVFNETDFRKQTKNPRNLNILSPLKFIQVSNIMFWLPNNLTNVDGS